MEIIGNSGVKKMRPKRTHAMLQITGLEHQFGAGDEFACEPRRNGSDPAGLTLTLLAIGSGSTQSASGILFAAELRLKTDLELFSGTWRPLLENISMW